MGLAVPNPYPRFVANKKQIDIFSCFIMAFNLETDLVKVLEKIDNKIDKLDQKLDDLKDQLNSVDKRLVVVETKLTIMEGSQRGQIWSLIVILATAVLGILIAGARVFFFPNP
jgi:hypothetical protein